MSHQALIENLKALMGLYRSSNRKKKTKLLNDAVMLTGKSRKTIIRYLSSDPNKLNKQPSYQGRGRRPVYLSDELLPHIRRIWTAMERISALRMKAGLHEWLSYYRHEDYSPAIALKLQKMSAATLDRFLSELRRENQAHKGIPTTSSGLRAMKAKIPINTLDHKANRPGFTQADTVSHCGTSSAGPFLSTLTLTDLWSGWTHTHAIGTKKALDVRKAFVEIKKSLPFELLAVNTDSGSEFLNTPIIEFMTSPESGKRITFTRSRPYQKNDNAYVEQKNYTHVRQLFGYERIEDQNLVALMNEIYSQYWMPLHNFFLPSQKLVEKIREGAKIKKRFDHPQTPFDRLMNSNHLNENQKSALKERKHQFDPFALSQSLELKLKLFFHRLHQSKLTPRNVA